jgi:hypothetical protein
VGAHPPHLVWSRARRRPQRAARRRWVSESTPHGIRAQSSLPGGVSGDASSPYYTNLQAGWLTNDTFEQTLQRGAIVRAALSVTHYRP